MVTDTIIVRTVSFRSPDITLEWKGHSDGTYTITELTEKMPVGTEIILRHSNKATEADAADYYHADEISNLIYYYGLFLQYPVYMISGNERTRLNLQMKLDAEKNKFLCMKMGKMFLGDDFLDCFNLVSSDGLFSGIAYVLPYPVSASAHHMNRIYLKSMLLTENGDKLLPEWAFFIRCIIETSDVRIFNLSDNIQNFIMEHTDELDVNSIYDYGIGLAVYTKNYEAVKLGLIVLELFSDYNDKLLDAIMKLSSCDEFTLYCIWAVRKLENANELIFKMAQHTNGWGKIFAVYYLNVDTDEIKDWILHYGVHNSIHPGYLANKCFDSADVRELLKGEPDISEMQAIAYIIYFLTEEGPAVGIRTYDDADEIIDLFLENAERFGEDDTDDENFFRIVSFIQKYRDEPDNDKQEE